MFSFTQLSWKTFSDFIINSEEIINNFELI